MDIPFMFLINSMYFLDMFHVFSLVCFLIYGVKSRSGHDRSQSFGGIPYIFPRYVPCIFPCVFLNLWSQEKVRTWRKSEFWSNLARFGSRNGILTKFINDSASFLPEKLKNHVILAKNLNIWPTEFLRYFKIF